MYGNVSSEFLPDSLPLHIYPGAALDYVHNTNHFNAAYEVLEHGIRENGWDDRVAIVSAATSETLRYKDLLDRVERFAWVLRKIGVEPGDRIVWRLGERPEAHIVQLATWKVGAINVPCPMAERAREIQFYINDTEASVVVASDSSLDEVEEALSGASSVEETVVVGGDNGKHRSFDDMMDRADRFTDYANTVPTDAASILYTGGTTGKAKGCLHSHAAEVICADNDGARGFELKPDDVVFTHGPIGHAFGNLLKVTLPLRHGASLILVDRPSAPEMLSTVEDEGVTVLWMIETMARMILDECDLAEYDTSSLRISIINEGTEDTYGRWKDLVGVQPGNAFGMTPLRGHPIMSHRGGEKVAPDTSLGKPYGGYEVKVVGIDDPTEELDRDEAGHLALRGPTNIVYWCNIHPEMPQQMERDIVDGWSIIDDVFVRDDEGYLYFKTRIDDMINSAGRLISPVDVESVLINYEGVEDVAVVGAPDDVRGEIVRAHIVTEYDVSDRRAFEEGIQQFAKERMAPYKYPREIEFEEAIPRDEVGKVQRGELRNGVLSDEGQ